MRKSGTGLDVGRSMGVLLPMLYRSVVDDQAMTELMRQIGNDIGAEWAVILVHPYDGSAPQFAAAHGIPEAAQASYDAHFNRLEPWPAWSMRAGVPFGTPALSHEMASTGEVLKLEYYHDFWRPHSDLLHTAGSLFAIDEQRFGHVAFPRARRYGEYPATTKALISELNPHLGAALKARFAFERQRLRDRLLARAFDAIQDPVFLLDRFGLVEVANIAADAWLQQVNSEVSLVRGRWVARSSAVQVTLDCLLGSSVHANRVAHAREARIDIAGESSHWHLTPLVEDASDRAAAPGFAGGFVRVSFPERHLASVVRGWSRQYGFTNREREVCVCLLQGHSARAIAAAAGVSYETVRTQIKQVLTKAGARRQSELMTRARQDTAGGAVARPADPAPSAPEC